MAVVGFDHDALERLEVGVLAQEVHPAHRSVQGMVHLPIWCFSCGSRSGAGHQRAARRPILAASPFPHPGHVSALLGRSFGGGGAGTFSAPCLYRDGDPKVSHSH